MGNSTSANGGNNLATIGTPHAGMTVGPTDICKLPNNVPAPFPNIAPVDRNPAGMTSQRTVVATKQIITIKTRFGQPSDPAHPGVNKGIKSLTYRSFAMVQVGSQDLRTEGQPPGRHLDATYQNSSNTVGLLKDLAQALDAANKNAEKFKRCTIVQLDVIEDSPARPAIGGFLEIVEGSTITCTAHRKNMAAATVGQPPMNAPPPDCTVPPDGWMKTKWRVVRTGSFIRQTSSTTLSKPGDKDETKEGVDEFKLTADWVGDPPAGAPSKMTKSKGTTGPTEALTRGATAARQAGTQMGPTPGANATLGQLLASPQLLDDRAAFLAAKQKAEFDAYKKTKDRIQATSAKFKADSKTDAKIILTFQMFRDLWSSFVPPQIAVSASACTGAFVTLVKVYPQGPFEFDLITVFKTFFKPFETMIDGMKNLFKGLKPSAGSDWDVGILNTSLVGGNAGTATPPTLKIGWEFKELTKDAENDGPKKHCVGLSWKVALGIEKALFARADFSVSLFAVAGGPGFGLVAKKVLDWCGIKLDLGIAIEIAIGVTGFIARDEYHVLKDAEIDTSLTVMVSLYLLARAGDFGSARCDFTLAFSVVFADLRCGQGVKPPIEVHVTKRRTTLSFQATVTANVRGFREGKKFPDAPYDIIQPVTWPDEWKAIPLI